MKVLVFDIYGDFAHFRKYYTTTSPLTFSFPPPPTIAGILGAIYGAQKDEYLNVFGYDNCKVALRVLNPIKKMRLGINLINTKDNRYFLLLKKKNHEPRTQILTEFVKSPKYRIYLWHPDADVFNKLASMIQSHQSFYTVSLGLSELLADFSFIGVYEGKEISNEKSEISTVVSISKLIEKGIEIQPERKYFKEKIPIKMTEGRVVEIYDDVIYEPDGKTIKAILKTFCQLENGEHISFF
ncbi:type I-B CRISPR-associated protein Cas5b [Thermodesulfovibrio sp. 3907-1M]|uniref:Type I-B CRISPR-associated protein Cas5b n=1 Tax=Thermodesulfovibrio autotrophicus TaxID=3118333 RepID=A0AAU8GYM2_9BACT